MSTPPVSNLRRMIRQTLTIARRDFVATVFTPTFLIFLFTPVIMLSFGAIGGFGASSMANSPTDKASIVAIVAPAQQAAMRATDARLRKLYSPNDQPPKLVLETPGDNPAGQAHIAFSAQGSDATAALYGDLTQPTVLYGGHGRGDAAYLAELAEGTLRTASSGTAPLSKALFTSIVRSKPSQSGQRASAYFTVFGIFFLTLLLAGQAVGTMAEERNNKVVEVLAAAVPLEAVFFGKLIGMFGSAVLFIAFWGTLVSQVHAILPGSFANALGDIGPAVGEPAFVLLFFAYFTMSYLLLGGVFLGVGAQATTPRELQMLSLPITVMQVAIFGTTTFAAAKPDSWIAKAVEIFPFSSPYAMAAYAANSPLLWPHALALAWQLLWVAIVIGVGARAFRRGVLQSGSGKINWKGLFGGGREPAPSAIS
jgi:ABC-2 type transport system permease protein